MRNIGIFGGSFDPVHSGHVRVAQDAVDRLSLDLLLIVPAAVSPFKTREKRVKPGYDRLSLAAKAFKHIPCARIDLREIERGGVSYTIDTVRSIAAEFPGDRLFLIVGEDSMQTLPQWKDYEELEKLCVFASFPRTRESSTEVRRRLLSGESISGLVPAGLEKEYAK